MIRATRLVPLIALRRGVCSAPMTRLCPIAQPLRVMPVSPLWAIQRRAIRVGGKTRTETMVEERVEQEQATQQTTSLQQQQDAQVAGQSGQSSAAVVEGDIGLQRFLRRTTMQTSAGLGITAVAAAMSIFGVIPLLPAKMMMVTSIGAIGLIIGASMMQPTIHRDELGNLTSTNSVLRQLLANSFFFVQGMLLAPILAMSSPAVIVAAGLSTFGIAAGMTAFALSKPQGALLSWGGPLMVGMFGLLFCSIGGYLIGGAAASAMFWVTTIGSLGIFSAFVAYDIQSAIQQYKNGFADHLGHAINMYINLINLFRSLLILFGMMDE